jgi:hypothetical protein
MITDDINDTLFLLDEINFKFLVASWLKPAYWRSALASVEYFKWCCFDSCCCKKNLLTVSVHPMNLQNLEHMHVAYPPGFD